VVLVVKAADSPGARRIVLAKASPSRQEDGRRARADGRSTSRGAGRWRQVGVFGLDDCACWRRLGDIAQEHALASRGWGRLQQVAPRPVTAVVVVVPGCCPPGPPARLCLLSSLPAFDRLHTRIPRLQSLLPHCPAATRRTTPPPAVQPLSERPQPRALYLRYQLTTSHISRVTPKQRLTKQHSSDNFAKGTTAQAIRNEQPQETNRDRCTCSRAAAALPHGYMLTNRLPLCAGHEVGYDCEEHGAKS